MDQSIRLAVSVDHFARGQRARARNVPIDGHNMNSSAEVAIEHWQAGWRQEDEQQRSRSSGNRAGQQLGEVSPP